MSSFLGHYLELLEEFRPPVPARQTRPPACVPAVSLHQVGRELVLTVRLPGVAKEDITLKASTTTLYLSVPDMLSRAVALPVEIEPEGVRAVFHDGLLRVTCQTVPRPGGDARIEID